MRPAFSTRPGLIPNNVPQTRATQRSEIKRRCRYRAGRTFLLRTCRVFLWGVERILWPVHRESLIPSRMSTARVLLSLAEKRGRAVNPIAPLNAVVTYASSKLLTNSRLKFVARERKCAQQLRRETIVHSSRLRMDSLPRLVTETERARALAYASVLFFSSREEYIRQFMIIQDSGYTRLRRPLVETPEIYV